jgi:Predicted glycosyltransferases
MSKNDPLISIIILNHNGLAQKKQTLVESLKCALSTQYSNKEIIFVDNGSTDGSVEFVKQNFPREIKIVALQKNFGHAAGMNAGVKACSKLSKYLVFVNNDVVYSPNTLSALVNYLERDNSISVLSCTEVFPNRDVNYCGSFFDVMLFNVPPVCSSLCYVTTVENFMIVRKGTFESVGGFDENLLNVFDEQEFCLRIWMCGYKVACVPTHFFLHKHTFPNKETPVRWALDLKNKYLSILKLYSKKGILKYLTLRVLFDLYKSIAKTNWRRNAMFFRIIKVWLEILRNPCFLKQRRMFSKIKKIDEGKLYTLGILKDQTLFTR